LAAKLGNLLRMNQIDHELAQLIASLHAAMPQPHLWSGDSAKACIAEIQKIADALMLVRANLIALPWLG
jgi:hypothetical protein